MKNIRKKVKTSYSISQEEYLELHRAMQLCEISLQNLIKIVMARYTKKLHKNLILEDNVISYNKHGKEGYKKVYVRLSAKEYCILLQLKFNTRYSTSYLLSKSIQKCLDKIVMALLKKKKQKNSLNNMFFQNLILKLDRFYTFWPNIEVEENVLPFFQMNLDSIFY